jgi:hypothetical protein
MNVAVLQRACGALIALYGLVGTVAPRRLLRLKARLALLGFDGGDPEPRPWLVEATRTASVAALVSGLVTVGLAGRLPAGEAVTPEDGVAGDDGD